MTIFAKLRAGLAILRFRFSNSYGVEIPLSNKFTARLMVRLERDYNIWADLDMKPEIREWMANHGPFKIVLRLDHTSVVHGFTTYGAQSTSFWFLYDADAVAFKLAHLCE